MKSVIGSKNDNSDNSDYVIWVKSSEDENIECDGVISLIARGD